MNSISGDTPVQLTIKNIVWVTGTTVVTILGAAAGLYFFLYQDIASVRSSMDGIRERNAETLQAATTGDGELRKQISALTLELRKTNETLSGVSARFADLGKSVGGLSSQMVDLSDSVNKLNGTVITIDSRLDISIERQKAFERAVLLYMGPAGDKQDAIAFPEGWKQSQDILYKNILERGDPLSTWLNYSNEDR